MDRKRVVRWIARAVTTFTVAGGLALFAGIIASFAYPDLRLVYINHEFGLWSKVGTGLSVFGMSILGGLLVALIPSWRIGSILSAGAGLLIFLTTLLAGDRERSKIGFGVAAAGIVAALAGAVIHRVTQKGLHPVLPAIAVGSLAYSVVTDFRLFLWPEEPVTTLIFTAAAGVMAWAVAHWAREKPAAADGRDAGP